MIQIVGYGSLLSEDSARRTAPTLTDFRVVRVSGWVRIFNKVSLVWREREEDGDPRSVAVLAAREREDASFLGTAFEVSEDEFHPIFEREHHYRWVDVECLESDGSLMTGRMCAEWTDAAYHRERCVTDAEYERRVGRRYGGPLWRDDAMPNPRYVEFCLDAARSLGVEVYEDFLDTTFLGDGRTTLRSWLADTTGAWRT